MLAVLIGQKPEAVDDPRRMEKNAFYIQVNYNGQNMAVDFDKVRSLPESTRQEIVQQMYASIDDAGAEELMNS